MQTLFVILLCLISILALNNQIYADELPTSIPAHPQKAAANKSLKFFTATEYIFRYNFNLSLIYNRSLNLIYFLKKTSTFYS